MPFQAGNQAAKGRRNPEPKTIWLLESLQKHGFNYETVLVKLLDKAAKGDRHALDMAHLLIKMVPYIANAPKSDHAAVEIDKLVINRFERGAITAPATESQGNAGTLPLREGHPPLAQDAEIINTPSQDEAK